MLWLLFLACAGGKPGDDCSSPRTWYPDFDGDGFGAEPGEESCSPPDGHTNRPGDCDDSDPAVYFGADETCNGVDDDCDGVVDPDDSVDAAPCYTDNDGDGYGGALSVEAACACPDGTAHGQDDCDDYDAAVHPGAVETWYDGTDADCLGDDDDDADGDGYAGHGLDATDCDDKDPDVHPGAEEICADGVDDNCDGVAPECGVGGYLTPDYAETRIEGHVPAYFAQHVAFAGDNDGDGTAEVISARARNSEPDEDGTQIQYRVFNVPTGATLDADTDTVAVFEPPGFIFDSSDDSGSTGISSYRHIIADTDLDGDGYTDFLMASPTSGSDVDSRFDLWYGPASGTIDLSGADTVLGVEPYPDFGQAVALLDTDGAGAFSVAVLNNDLDCVDEDVANLFILTDEHFIEGQAIGDSVEILARSDYGIMPPDSTDIDGDGVGDLGLLAVSSGLSPSHFDFHVLLGPFESDRSTADSEMTIGAESEGAFAASNGAIEQEPASGYPRLVVTNSYADCDEGSACGAAYIHEFDEGSYDATSDAAVTLIGPPESWSGYFGGTVTWVGDLDADGKSELLVPAEAGWLADPLSLSYGSSVFVIEVPESGTWNILDIAEAMVWSARKSTEDPPTHAAWGDRDIARAILPGHDFTGDGIDDLVLGSPGWDAGFEDDSPYESGYYGRILMFEGGATGF